MRDHRHSGVAGPLILIAIGAAFLLTNMGLLSWSAWGLFRLWPLILVAAGIDLLIGRRSTAGAIVAAVLIAAILGGGLWLASTGYQAPAGSPTETVEQPLGGATQADITLRPAVGELHISALPQSSPNLITGDVKGELPEDVRSQFNSSAGSATFQMETVGSAVFVPAVGTTPSWTLMLNPGIPIRMNIEQGVGELSLDLTSIHVTDLTVNLGVGQITVRLPDYGQYTARIDGAVGDTTVVLPQTLAAKITMNAALAGRSVPDGFTREGNVYVTADYLSASDRVDLVLGQAIGNVSVRRAAP
jgi:hypothetical protein